MTTIRSISLVGYGRLARTLVPALVDAGCTIDSWHIRNQSLHEEVKESFGIQPVKGLNQLSLSSDLCLLMVPDAVINPIANQLPMMSSIVAHTSGATPVETLPQSQRGRFYPLVTFNGRSTWTSDVPVIVQSDDEAVNKALRMLAQRISDQVPNIDEDKMTIVHLSAVFAQNFSNHFIDMAERILDQHGLNRQLIQPLLRAMLDNLEELPASFNQTGPAVRQDESTLERHRQLLDTLPSLLRMYNEATRSIQEENIKN